MALLTSCGMCCGRRKESASPRIAWISIEEESKLGPYLCPVPVHGAFWTSGWSLELVALVDWAEIPLGFSASLSRGCGVAAYGVCSTGRTASRYH